MKNKTLKVVLSFILIFSVFSMVGLTGVAATAKADDVTLTFNVNLPATDVTYKNLETVVANFEKANPGIIVELSSPADYETTMKTKMAANQLPDLWATHGWSVARYSEYLLPIQDQPFIKKLNPLIKPVVTDKNGKVYALPMDVDVAGIAYNKDVLTKAKINPDTIKTWDDFKVACKKLKTMGKIPVYLGGSKDDWTVGNFFDWVAPTFLVTGTKNFGAQLLNGSFDWNNYKPVAQLYMDFIKAGYFNKNADEGTWPEVGEQLAKGNAGFAFFGNYVIAEAQKYNPKGNYGFMPLPAVKAGDPQTLISGERSCFGVWKDTPHKAEALKFLNYLAQPQNVNLVAAGGLNPTGLVGAGYKTSAGSLTQYFDKYVKVKSYPYFDRVYLPNGMWDSLCKTGTGMLAGTMNMSQVITKLKTDYTNLRQQQ